MEIINYTPNYLSDVKIFTDKWIGENYYSEEELKKIYEYSLKGELNASFLAFVDEKLAGVRMSFAPGLWVQSFERGLSFDKWRVPKDKVGYFKSLFVAEEFQKRGIGKTLSSKSINVLKAMGAQAILCHSWLESPGNSSQKYLARMGFESVAQHPEFWKPIDYLCTRCAPKRCECTALEMILYL